MYQVQRKRHGGLFWLLLFVFAFIVGLVLGYGGIRLNQARTETEPQKNVRAGSEKPSQTEEVPLDRPASVVVKPAEEAEAPPEANGFFVVTQDGSVCVFRLDAEGNREFSHKLPIVLDALRQTDRELFQKGLHLPSRQALLELTEDFAS
ncbi:MAG: hypothetical protein E7402_04615 [Ruminococcaceae bacterium]|nr:hypothetical protein [Oscillospiraceae bacterium]